MPSYEELVEHLREQVGFLRVSGAVFDIGGEPEAKRLAVTIRVLVHDTNMSHSLLDQLGKKDSLEFVDTSIPPHPVEPGVLTTTAGAGLAGLTFRSGSPPRAIYIAPLASFHLRRPAPFDDWWTTTIISDRGGNKFSRRDLVLALAHQEGGAHVQPELEEAYKALARSNSLGWSYSVDDGTTQHAMGNPAPANVRQVAWELQTTIEEQLSNLLL